MKSRTKARGLALQVLYEYDQTGHEPNTTLENLLLENNIEQKIGEFSKEIITGVIPLITELDHAIEKHAQEWPLDQVAIIDRNIIRIALWEFAVEQISPIKVAINEAVELAKEYGSESTPRFVNGVLGSLANHISELTQKFSRVKRSEETKLP
jgi:N utilization substance protein B